MHRFAAGEHPAALRQQPENVPPAAVPPDVKSLLALAHDQNGLFRARQARELGVSRRWIARRVGNRLSVLLPEVYWLRTGPPPRPVQLDAALLYAGSGAALSHWTAAECWGFRDVM